MTGILTGAPLWVWPLLLLLVIVGLRARRDRQAPAILIYAMPLLGILALRSTAALPASMWIWLVFVTAYLSGAKAGYQVQGRWLSGRVGKLVRLKGENLTLVVVMVVFWANFAGGFLQAVLPDVYANAVFHMAFTALIALGAGSFAGRAVRVFQSV